MANSWFRMYAEFAHNPKVQMLSETMQRRYVMLLCMRCSDAIGDSNNSDLEIAFYLRISEQEAQETKRLLIARNLIDSTWNPVNWSSRQFTSDSSVERVKKYRATRKEAGLLSNGYTKHSETVTQRDGNCCVYCGSSDNLCIDHILPITLGGNDDIENLATACKQCNSGKSGRTPGQAGYGFLNKSVEKIWNEWVVSRYVTVTVTPQNRTEQNRTENKEPPLFPPTAPAAQRGTRLAENWEPPPELMDQMRLECSGMDVDRELRQFRDYWSSVPGQRGCKLDWPATWRVWCRKSYGDGKSGKYAKVNECLTDRAARLGKLADEREAAAEAKAAGNAPTVGKDDRHLRS